jgi:hypothetical protein
MECVPICVPFCVLYTRVRPCDKSKTRRRKSVQKKVLSAPCLSHFCKAKMQLWRAFLQAFKNSSQVQISLAVTRAPLALAIGLFWLFFFFLPNDRTPQEPAEPHPELSPHAQKGVPAFRSMCWGGAGPGGEFADSRTDMYVCVYHYLSAKTKKS